MRILVVQLYYVVVSAKIVCHFPLEWCTCKSSPEELLSLYHSFVRFCYPSEQIQKPSLLCISLKLSRKLLLVILLELLLDNPNDSRYLLILTFPQQIIHFLVCVVSRIKIDETLQSWILFLLLEFLLCDTFLPVIGYLFKHERKDVGGCEWIFLDGFVDRLHIFLLIFFVRSRIGCYLAVIMQGFLFLPERE